MFRVNVQRWNHIYRQKKIDSSNLITVNLLCHGVSSQKIFDTYLLEEYKGEKVLIYQFKNKKAIKGKINSRTAYVELANGKKYIKTMDNDAFLKGYYTRLFYRPSCAKCHFTCKERISDFTIADAWGIQKIKPEYNPLEGVSLILFNTPKAMNALEDINSRMNLEEVSAEWALSSQRLFRAPTEIHKNRDNFFELWKKTTLKKAVFKCTKPSLRQRLYRVKRKLISIIKHT